MKFHTGNSMCAVPYGLDEDDTFSPSGSSFSLSTSSYDPHTPTSGRSTPPRGSFDYASSFASSMNSHSIELKPPLSATNSYFPFAFKGDGASDFSQPCFPRTPSRSQLSYPSFSHSGYSVQLSPSQQVDYFCGDILFQQPVVVSPQQQLHSNNGWCENWRWPQDSHSPISFGEHTPKRPSVMVRHPQLKFEDDGEDLDMKKYLKENLSIEPSAMGLLPSPPHRVRDDSPPPPRQRQSRINDSKRAAKDSVHDVEPKAMHRCIVSGCTYGPYRRNEHLKRHLKNAHGIGGEQEEFICAFCPPQKSKDGKPKCFNRRDNWLQHIKLHMKPRSKKSRTQHNEEAVEVFNREQNRINRSKRFKGKVGKPIKKKAVSMDPLGSDRA